jgi:osmoprotectant transport system permease protein
MVRLGFGQQNYGLIIAGALLIALLAVLTELFLVLLTWAVTPGPKRFPWTLARRAVVTTGPEPTAAGMPL